MENNTSDGFKLTTPVAIVVAGALIMFGIIIIKEPNKTLKNNDTLTASAINTNTQKTENPQIVVAPVNASDHILGNKDTAQVIVIEFSDTECPFCKRFHPILQQAMAKYPGKILWVYRHFPLESLHSKSRNEARATECVAKLKGNNAFWQYIDMIYEKTPGNDGLDPELLPIYAEKVGVDKNAFNKCMTDDKAELDKIIDTSLADGQNAGVQGTPHSIIITKDNTQIPIVGADDISLNSTLESILK